MSGAPLGIFCELLDLVLRENLVHRIYPASRPEIPVWKILVLFSFLFKITREHSVIEDARKHISTLIMWSLVTKITRAEDALSDIPTYFQLI